MRVRLCAAALIALAASVVAGRSVEAAPPKLAVSVSYDKRACAGAKPKVTPVTAGIVELDRPGKAGPVRVTLEEDGADPGRIAVPGKGAITATLILETDRVKVVEAGSGPGARRILLGKVKKLPQNGRLAFSVPDLKNDVHGDVNVLVELVRAARTAALASPKPLQPVRAITGRPETAYARPDKIDVADPDQWEPVILAHEYGHHVLDEIAPLTAAGDHILTVSYPNRPKLAWSEGFPTAFAAVVHSYLRGQLTEKCKPIMNLAATPATPGLESVKDRRYAQYNELRVAAVTYALMRRIGAGSLDLGLKRLLDGLDAYRRDGHSVWTARDLRDLAVDLGERSAADHVAIDKIFLGQGMSWLRLVSVGLDFAKYAASGVVSAIPEITVRLVGPGGFDCRVRGGDIFVVSPPAKLDDGRPVLGAKSADGGLSYSANDDCYLFGGDGTPNELGDPPAVASSASLPFPYLDNLAHWRGDYELRARYVCRTFPVPPGSPPANCPSTAPVQVIVASSNEDPKSPRTYNEVSLGLNVEKTIVTFAASGKCDVNAGTGDTDCSL